MHETDLRPADELPGAGDADQEADDDQDADRPQVTAVVRMSGQPDSGQQLKDEDDEQARKERKLDPTFIPGTSPNSETESAFVNAVSVAPALTA